MNLRLFEVTTLTSPGKSVVAGRQFRDYFEGSSLDDALEQAKRLYSRIKVSVEYHSVVEVDPDPESLKPLVPTVVDIMEL